MRGFGAQTLALAQNSPRADITALDISEKSLALARAKIKNAGIKNVTFQQGDIFHLPFEASSFDHVFVCFVLEHLSNPVDVLVSLKKLIKPGGTITVIEGVRETAISAGLLDPPTFDKGIRDLYRTTETEGVFCYTFFKSFAEEG